ncbi:MAG: hypothetical protein GY913_09370 [Proteobacteria bacterium]|nr:hypothetical protein [Pseudomonadota bacterium]MCP4917122.1 hypothetical protein [Pseudomonadota bacterium]
MILALLTQASAATLVVDPDGGEYTSIADALAVAVTGDVLELSGDTFTECIDAGIDLTIRGTTGTVLDGSGTCAVVLTVNDGESVTVEDLEITNANGYGVSQYYSNTTLSGVTIRDSVEYTGAAIYTYGGALTTTACTFSNNSSDYGGAIYLYAYGSWTDTDSVFSGNTAADAGGAVESYYDNVVVLSGTTFSGNTAGGNGGGLWHGYWGDLSLADVTFEDNDAGGQGGGIFMYAQDTEVPIAHSTFSRNTAASHGGGIAMQFYADLVITDSVFEDNVAGSNGGGIYSYYTAHVTVSTSTFSGNSGTSGGAILHYPYESGGWNLVATDSTFTNNTATDGHGGALYTAWADAAELTGSTFEDNAASNYGGSLYVYVANTVDTSHSDFCQNTARVGGSHALEWVGADATWNSRFVDNTADYAGALWRYASYTGYVSYNSFVGNDGVEDGGAYYGNAAYSTWTGNLVAHTADGNGVVAHDTNTLLYTTFVDNGWADNHVLNGGGYFWIVEGEDGNVVADEPGFEQYEAGCAYDLRMGADAPLVDFGAYQGPNAVVEDHDEDGEDTTLDCDDTDGAVWSGADEVCNGIDDNCDGDIDSDAIDMGTWYLDEDGDGYGTDELVACEQPEGSADHPDDCDDTSAEIHPLAEEVLDDGIDNDCDGESAITPEPEPEIDDHIEEAEGNWACTSAPGGGWWALGLLGLLLRRRRD